MTWEKKFEHSPEIVVRKGNYHPLDPTHPPRSFPGITRQNRTAMIYTPLFQLTNSGSRVFPLFPEDCPQTPHNPAVERTKHTCTLRDAVVIPPATKVLVQVENYLMNRPATVAVG